MLTKKKTLARMFDMVLHNNPVYYLTAVTVCIYSILPLYVNTVSCTCNFNKNHRMALVEHDIF